MKKKVLISIIFIFFSGSAHASIPTVVGGTMKVKSPSTCVEYTAEATSWRSKFLATTQTAYTNVTMQVQAISEYPSTTTVWSAAQPAPIWPGSYIYREWYEKVSETMDSLGRYEWKMRQTQFTFIVNNDAEPDTDGDGTPDLCEAVDTDGDGVKDEIDPWPNDAQDFTWKESCSMKTANGTCVGWVQEFIRADGAKAYAHSGMDWNECQEANGGGCVAWYIDSLKEEISSTKESYIAQYNGQTYEETMKYYQNLNEAFAASKASSETKDQLNAIGSQDQITAPTTTTGENATTGATDSEALAKITNNTATIANNQQKISDGLTSLYNQGTDTNKLLIGMSNKMQQGIVTSGSGGDVTVDTLTQAEVQAAVKAGIENSTADGNLTNIAPDAPFTEAQTKINSTIDPESVPDEYKTKNDIKTKMQEIESGSGVSGIKALIQGNKVEASGSCSFSFDFLGHPITFSICEQADTLHTIGIIMQSITALICVLYIFSK